MQTAAVDTNGAGDTFATAYMLALALRDPHPGATANWAASRAVLRPQVCCVRVQGKDSIQCWEDGSQIVCFHHVVYTIRDRF